jgi:Tfp pilus assembly protein PilO
MVLWVLLLSHLPTQSAAQVLLLLLFLALTVLLAYQLGWQHQQRLLEQQQQQQHQQGLLMYQRVAWQYLWGKRWQEVVLLLGLCMLYR